VTTSAKGDRDDNFGIGNSALWQIWHRVSGPYFFYFSTKESEISLIRMIKIFAANLIHWGFLDAF
jgi:hypothetical protein